MALKFTILIVSIFLTLETLSQDISSRDDLIPGGYVGKTTMLGNSVVLSGEFIKLGYNSYWVKSGSIRANGGSFVVNFAKELTINNQKAIDQVKAGFGYIVEYVQSPKEGTAFYVWIANETGERNSDDLLIQIK